LSALLFFATILIIFQQKINFSYEKIVSKQNEEIITQRDQLFEQNSLILEQQKRTTDSLFLCPKKSTGHFAAAR
jgi:hypothetical protein